MSKSDNTPFHLRMNCLHMAEQMLTQKMNATKESGCEFFTTEDVMREAAKLYRFVCDKDAASTYGEKIG